MKDAKWHARRVLGISDRASREEIQRAADRLARRHDSDLGGDAFLRQRILRARDLLLGQLPNPFGYPGRRGRAAA